MNKVGCTVTKKNDQYESFMGGRLELFTEIFNTGTFSRSILKVICLKVLSNSRNGRFGLKELKGIFRTLLFSLNGNACKKSNEQEDQGAETCHIKRTIFLDCLESTHNNVDRIFSDVVEDSTRPRRPFWLKLFPNGVSYLPEQALKEGFNRREKCITDKESMKRRAQIGEGKISPNASDYAEYVGHRLYEELTKKFNNSRRWTVTMLFESLLYLFYDWNFTRKDSKDEESFEDIKEESLKLKWVDKKIEPPLIINDVPRTLRSAAAVDNTM